MLVVQVGAESPAPQTSMCMLLGMMSIYFPFDYLVGAVVVGMHSMTVVLVTVIVVAVVPLGQVHVVVPFLVVQVGAGASLPPATRLKDNAFNFITMSLLKLLVQQQLSVRRF